MLARERDEIGHAGSDLGGKREPVIKICGIRSVRDAHIAVEAGATAIGVICGVTHTSEDAVPPETALELVRAVPAPVSTVLVTHLVEPADVVALAAELGVDVIQLHGEMTLDAAGEVRRIVRQRVLKAVHVLGPDAVSDARAAATVCDALLLDTRTLDRLGGTGLTHDWTISRRIVDEIGGRVPVVLAGGLRPANVAEAIATVGPAGVDVNSGVENSFGDKSPELCRAFVAAAASALSGS